MAGIEFRATVYRDAYFIPTIGIAILGVIGAGFLASIPGVVDANAAGTTTGAVLIAVWLVAAGVFAAAWWVRLQWRIHHERRLIIDDAGITYVPFDGQSRLMRWTDIESVVEKRGLRRGSGCFLRLRLRHGTFVININAFDGYFEIRERVAAAVPDRIRLMRAVPAGPTPPPTRQTPQP